MVFYVIFSVFIFLFFSFSCGKDGQHRGLEKTPKNEGNNVPADNEKKVPSTKVVNKETGKPKTKRKTEVKKKNSDMMEDSSQSQTSKKTKKKTKSKIRKKESKPKADAILDTKKLKSPASIKKTKNVKKKEESDVKTDESTILCTPQWLIELEKRINSETKKRPKKEQKVPPEVPQKEVPLVSAIGTVAEAVQDKTQVEEEKTALDVTEKEKKQQESIYFGVPPLNPDNS
ncbi:unnamed protein product [Bursaphelenchus okinawaensis]|uniref:Uncharacterized protein n=1 Tax=Bursaphelenchus okinawaensis TaxID=465554 RepID=A0A811JSF1_9BILA|nr:unnamed protein product [Bursaphelenchus okinawaensis]CAG9080426.1 unnamed protein product [Bursaphelenchus okinawaensis]